MFRNVLGELGRVRAISRNVASLNRTEPTRRVDRRAFDAKIAALLLYPLEGRVARS